MTTLGWFFVILAAAVVAGGGGYYLYWNRPNRDKSTQSDSYVEALRALLDKNPTLAFLKLKETVTHDSNNIDAYLRLAVLLRQRGMHAKSLQLSTDLSIRQNVSPADRVRILYSLADDYIANSNLQLAESIYRQLSHMPGQKATAHHKLGELYQRMENWEEAFKSEEEYLRLTNNRDKSPLGRFKLRIAEKLVAAGELRKARVEYKEALKFDPSCAEAVVGMGDAYMQEGRTEDAVKAWREIVSVAPKKAELVFDRLQKALFDLGQFGEIEDLYNQILERDENNLAALTGLANLSEKKGDIIQSEDIYHRILDYRPDYRPAIVGLLRLYRENNRLNEAAQVINRTLESLNPVDG
jgi:lipopolysaccharide biosynthesis regulator YciM